MQMRIQVIKMDGEDGEEVETQIVGTHGPMISVALYTKTQYVKALIDTCENNTAKSESKINTKI